MDHPHISRRDFLNGVALSVAAGATLSPRELMAREVGENYYPPAQTGLRGSHPGSFETAHALAWEGQRWPQPAAQTDATYDLVVVGGGISGLAAAYLYRQRMGADAEILVLDNHDDFGGHAKRNEFTVSGRQLIGYGGSQSIDGPAGYSKVAAGLLAELGIDTERFYDYFDVGFGRRHGLAPGILFDDARFGAPELLPSFMKWFEDLAPATIDARIDTYPLAADTRAALQRMMRGDIELTDVVRGQIAAMKATPVEPFLKVSVGMTEEGFFLLRGRSRPLWGAGLDTLSVAETAAEGMLGGGMYEAVVREYSRLTGEAPEGEAGEPYIFHFPDGNATIARLLVRSLIPGAVPGSTMEDVVRARARYEKLDRKENGVRIRLNSAAVQVENRAGGVDVTYRRGEATERVRGKHCVLACYNNVIPYLCPEVGDAQREALTYAEKCPLMLVNVALRSWQALAQSGISGFYSPSGFLTLMDMDFPVSLGGYQYTAEPSQPVVLQGWHVPAVSEPGTPAREQFRAGRRQLYTTSFAEFEAAITGQLDQAWGRHGLDVARDIAAITVNRWPHGYAYEYMDLWDDPSWGRGAGPHVVGRQQLGNITIANSDSESYAYVNGAIDAAYRAVRELTTT